MTIVASQVPGGLGLDRATEGPFPDDMAEYAVPEYTKAQVVSAGRLLGREIPPDEKEAAVEAFRIAYNWRNSHAWPLRLVRAELAAKLRSAQLSMPTVGRLKRMKSIRKKLSTSPYSLYQIQDLGGCRVIFPSIDHVKVLVEQYRSGDTQHELKRDDDYILRPKKSGYRCHHLVFKYRGGKDHRYPNQWIEMQVRTQMQHAWATAVEAVGLYRGEDLKGGSGDPDWLRFFQLVAAEFAAREQCPLPASTPESEAERWRELRQLNEKLRAIQLLARFGQALKQTVDRRSTGAKYFLIIYDNENKTVRVRPFDSVSVGSEQYSAMESAKSSSEIVLVEVDKIDDLKAAYPNYFLDVRLFLSSLRTIIPSSDDFSWLHDWKDGR